MPPVPRRRRAPATKQPCESCKVKHIKCDNESPVCRHCQAKGLQCVRVAKPASFRPGSAARYDALFTGKENWVSGNPREFRVLQAGEEVSGLDPAGNASLVATPTVAVVSDSRWTQEGSSANPSPQSVVSPNTNLVPSPSSGISPGFSNVSVPVHANSISASPSLTLGSSQTITQSEPLQDVQEACLLRFYIEEIAPWIDTCDERRHFQLFIPTWARQYPPLMNAVLATSARYLTRLPRYITENGVSYKGQLLPNLTPGSAVEYMLLCMPALRDFHDTQDPEHRELIVATAVILRQYEEMEDDEHAGERSEAEEAVSAAVPERVNFLDIINAVIRSSHSTGRFDREGLFDVAYWISLRQEVYYGFVQGRSPQMLLGPEQWLYASTVNKTIMHAAQVAKWLFEDRSEQGWLKLREQESLLDQQIHSQTQYAPILKLPPDKSKGEVFPTIWYGSDLAVVGIQHALIARMVLIAEDPTLKWHANPRVATRTVESKVRELVLETAGIALHRLHCPPALVNAAMAIYLYGDFFTDQWERAALVGVIDQFRGVRAWPIPKTLQTFE